METAMPDLARRWRIAVLAFAAFFFLNITPVEASWSPGPPVAGQGGGRTVTTLLDGRILFVGGPTAYVYDPVGGTFSPTGPMSVARNGHTATLLPDGRVFVAGGGNDWTSTETYDPATNAWTPAAPMPSRRSTHSAALLPGGKVLLVGGLGETASCQHWGGWNTVDAGNPTADIYDPASNTWSPAPPPPTLHEGGSATSLSNGKVLLVGGSEEHGCDGGVMTYSVTYVADLYDSVTNTWSPAPPPPYVHGVTIAGWTREIALPGSPGGLPRDASR
jgi:hypothetical protein